MNEKELSFTETNVKELLLKYGKTEDKMEYIFRHTDKVRILSKLIYDNLRDEIKQDVDLHLIEMGALLHDIGTLIVPNRPEKIKHGIVGYKLLNDENLPNFALFARNHIGIGLRKEFIIDQNIDLPLDDYIPTTIEQKIVAYADNIVYGVTIKDENFVVERFVRNLGEKYRKYVLEFHEEIHKLLKNKIDFNQIQ